MPASSRPLSVAVLALALAMGGCGTSLVSWVPVVDGADTQTDHVVSRDGVVVSVEDFGVRDGWGKPAGELRVFNNGDRAVSYDLATTRLDVDGELVPPILDLREGSLVTLQPGESHAAELVFDTTLPIQPRTDEGSQKMLVITRELHLHLPALRFGEQEAALPVLIYRNPDPLER